MLRKSYRCFLAALHLIIRTTIVHRANDFDIATCMTKYYYLSEFP